ncbi:EAL domain-containing protein [Kamptonema animale CS-326]|jgi:diguanylate cyclase (GGDEF)-like protein|uniref:putative bifunctional diguanylate cyclase/phosphodiesterase n=1 Tax=Kamptonema animale TaxID=92934 RepID=UPI00232EB38E|nr:EAL domain-containing protein [Kamptonema animale]MDB9509745.1 EAL domain-containing protein [Kamptonema animale CS-326]
MSRAKILIVEDESIIAEDIADSLKVLGYSISAIVFSGEEAIQAADDMHPDLVLMDIHLQGKMDGITAAEEIRSRFQIPVVYLTAYADDNTLQRVNATKPFGYVVKPFEEKNLHSAIQIALHRHQYDYLTNLPNRSLLRERLNQILEKQKAFQTLIPIVSLSVDRINKINGTLGHSIGDSVLRIISQRLTNCNPNFNMVARLEAAEFAIIMPLIEEKEDTGNVAQTILDIISDPIVVDGYEVYVTASIGIAFYPGDGTKGDELLKNAYAAMYYAQQQGGNSYQFYTSKSSIVSINQIIQETSLRNAIKCSEFEVYYQPQVELKTGKIVGAEALLRWNHPERGLVYPDEFIALAEEMGLIIPLGEWVLQTACKQTKLWQESGFSPLRIAVNLSGRQFNQKNIAERVKQILKETGLDPKYLELEVTESLVIQNESAATKAMTEWRTLGIKIAVDDFGTGYSSLSYPKRFPFDIIKIDRSFICNITNDPKNAAITKAIIQMAHSLNMKVIAEGVETQAELDFLYQYECDEMQGYFFSKALTNKEFEELLKKGQCLPSVEDN